MPLRVASKDVRRMAVQAIPEAGAEGPTTVTIRERLDEASTLRASMDDRSPAFSITYSELVALHLSARGWADAQIAGVLGVLPAAVAALVDSVDERLGKAYAAHLSGADGGGLS